MALYQNSVSDVNYGPYQTQVWKGYLQCTWLSMHIYRYKETCQFDRMQLQCLKIMTILKHHFNQQFQLGNILYFTTATLAWNFL